jgi:hypothetical protein
MKGLHVCNVVEPHPFIPDPDDEWKPDAERECLACTRYPPGLGAQDQRALSALRARRATVTTERKAE